MNTVVPWQKKEKLPQLYAILIRWLVNPSISITAGRLPDSDRARPCENGPGKAAWDSSVVALTHMRYIKPEICLWAAANTSKPQKSHIFQIFDIALPRGFLIPCFQCCATATLSCATSYSVDTEEPHGLLISRSVPPKIQRDKTLNPNAGSLPMPSETGVCRFVCLSRF